MAQILYMIQDAYSPMPTRMRAKAYLSGDVVQVLPDTHQFTKGDMKRCGVLQLPGIPVDDLVHLEAEVSELNKDGDLISLKKRKWRINQVALPAGKNPRDFPPEDVSRKQSVREAEVRVIDDETSIEQAIR